MPGFARNSRSTALCVFSDASQDAFGTCTYIRQEMKQNTYEVNFVAAKSRVAPLKQLTVPCLELQVAVLDSRLMKTIVTECVSSSLLIVHSGFKLVPRRHGSKKKSTWSENGGHV